MFSCVCCEELETLTLVYGWKTSCEAADLDQGRAWDETSGLLLYARPETQTNCSCVTLWPLTDHGVHWPCCYLLLIIMLLSTWTTTNYYCWLFGWFMLLPCLKWVQQVGLKLCLIHSHRDLLNVRPNTSDIQGYYSCVKWGEDSDQIRWDQIEEEKVPPGNSVSRSRAPNKKTRKDRKWRTISYCSAGLVARRGRKLCQADMAIPSSLVGTLDADQAHSHPTSLHRI